MGYERRERMIEFDPYQKRLEQIKMLEIALGKIVSLEEGKSRDIAEVALSQSSEIYGSYDELEKIDVSL